jgi:hypothetical protein
MSETTKVRCTCGNTEATITEDWMPEGDGPKVRLRWEDTGDDYCDGSAPFSACCATSFRLVDGQIVVETLREFAARCWAAGAKKGYRQGSRDRGRSHPAARIGVPAPADADLDALEGNA